jgi:pimeloyl-ACP methyl ester carboxylesterase
MASISTQPASGSSGRPEGATSGAPATATSGAPATAATGGPATAAATGGPATAATGAPATAMATGAPVTATDWFASGTRRLYDPAAKTILDRAVAEPSSAVLSVFEKVVGAPAAADDVRWLTMLPGYPDGSYGYAQVDRLLGATPAPRLYVEYLGQGDSDKPSRYRYSSLERADLVEAQWRAHGVRRTVVVAFDYSSLALMELLRRQQEGVATGTTIDAVLIVNGGLFADCHSHPWDTTPMLRTPVGRLAMWFGQRVPGVLEAILRRAKLYSTSYEPSAAEIAELSGAIRRRGGAAFMHRGAGFVDEHRRNAARWDLAAIVRELQGTVTFEIAGSEEDVFEPRQIVAARERLAPLGVRIRSFPGGHLTTSEHPVLLADAIRKLADAHAVGEASSRAAGTTSPARSESRHVPYELEV